MQGMEQSRERIDKRGKGCKSCRMDGRIRKGRKRKRYRERLTGEKERERYCGFKRIKTRERD